MRINKALLAITFICIIIGFVTTMQYKSMKKINAGTSSIGSLRFEELQNLLRFEKEKNETLYKQVIEYKDEINEYQTMAAQNDSSADALKKDLDRAELIAGMTNVEGKGIIVTLRDSTMTNPLNQNENVFVVHDNDVLNVINELKAAGAEAVSVNDQRLVSTSEIRCSGNTITINNVRTGAPFVIKAIGDSKQLESGLLMRGGVVDTLTQWGIEVEIKPSEKVFIPAFDGNVENKFAVRATATPAPKN